MQRKYLIGLAGLVIVAIIGVGLWIYLKRSIEAGPASGPGVTGSPCPTPDQGKIDDLNKQITNLTNEKNNLTNEKNNLTNEKNNLTSESRDLKKSNESLTNRLGAQVATVTQIIQQEENEAKDILDGLTPVLQRQEEAITKARTDAARKEAQNNFNASNKRKNELEGKVAALRTLLTTITSRLAQSPPSSNAGGAGRRRP